MMKISKLYGMNRKIFFAACDLLDDISSQCASLDIVKNREWLASLYRKADDIFPQLNLKINEKLSMINDFIDNLEQCKTDNDFTRHYIQKLKEKQYYLNQPVEELWQNFHAALEMSDLRWIQILNCLGILQPENKSAIYYQLQYNLAIDNNIMVTKLKQRLGNYPSP
ncbi:hypothetical protein [Paenibacillus medicaginis]|uniref:Uncharacterized protein n=1 Tax=Paenibacillus medicaginis TaxID=1470560 RepID=A0ABV5CBX9_9BACL